jgi:hypothetical protein
MSLHKGLLGLTAIASLLLGTRLALAEDTAPPPPRGPGFCQENPGKCEEGRAKRAAFCKDNPEKCAQMKQKRAERRELCEQNPQQCEEQRAMMKQHRAEMQARCEADPTKCDEMKQQARERWQAYHGATAPPADNDSGAASPK